MLLEQYKHHPARQFASLYLYVGNGYNPVNGVDPDGGIIHLANNQMQLLGYINQVSAKYFGSDAEARDINDFVNGGTYGALAIHGEYDGDYYYLHDGAGNEIYPEQLKFNVKTLFGACFSENYINNRSDENLVKPGYLPTGETQSFVESINFLIDNSDTEKINESGYDINFTDQ